MGKRTGKKPGTIARKPVAASMTAKGLRAGYAGPAGGRIRLIRPGEEHVADALLRTAGVDWDSPMTPYLLDGTLSGCLLTGLDAPRDDYYAAVLAAFTGDLLMHG
jgi:hypothetical protein